MTTPVRSVAVFDVMYRRTWSDELFDIVAAHPAVWAYRKLADHHQVKRMLPLLHPRELLPAAVAAFADVADQEIAAWARATRTPEPEPSLTERARTIAADGPAGEKANLALEPDLPADVLTALSADPDPKARTYVAMRPGFTEQQRAAIGHQVSADDRLPRLAWVLEADGEQLQRCVSSAHPGLRRSAACNRKLTADQIAALAADEDFPVRLLLCENQDAVPTDLVVRTYLEARVVTRGQLLSHPAITNADLTRYADSPQRLLELLADPATAEAAAANPALPTELMAAILGTPAGATSPPHETVLRRGHTMPTHEPITEI